MENPFYSASNTIIKNGSVFSKSANVIVFTIDKIVFDMPLTYTFSVFTEDVSRTENNIKIYLLIIP